MLKRVGICINTCEDNDEYIEINKFDIFVLANTIENYDIEKENQQMLSKVLEYEKANNKYIDKIAIRKDSLLGKYILNLPKGKVCNFDNIITFEKVTNALNIAIFEINPIAKKLIVPFMKQACGDKIDLIKEYGDETVNYIISNSNFNMYIQKFNGTYSPKKYYVYENSEIVNRYLKDIENVKVK